MRAIYVLMGLLLLVGSLQAGIAMDRSRFVKSFFTPEKVRRCLEPYVKSYKQEKGESIPPDQFHKLYLYCSGGVVN